KGSVSMKWLEVSISTTPENEEVVSGILYTIGADGLNIEDPQDVVDMTDTQDSTEWDFIDEKLLNLDMDKIVIKAYFSETEDIDKIKNVVLEKVEQIPYMEKGVKYGEVEFSYIEDRDWPETWKKGYKPMRVGQNLVIKPSWEDYEEKPEDIIIELDPGMAFGTGDHETTFMCLEALEEFIDSDNLVYDIGCGSGILSIAASKLGAKKVVGVDLVPLAVEVSEENVKINNETEDVQIIHGNLLDVVEDKADLIVANIIAEIIVEMSSDLKDFLKIDGLFIGSGIILSKIDLVVEALEKAGFEILEIREMNEWACIIARK
ncbi:MAG TPA: 50S ribosomal protein L11 methyltransferase, partial [Tissierellaceae bacterium]